MPELPEVETVCRGLQQTIAGKQIKAVIVRETRLRKPVMSEKLYRLLPGKNLQRIERRAKYIVMHLSDSVIVLAHLGMSGQIVVQPADEQYRKHDHIIANLSEGLQMRFHDPRRFGLFEALTVEEFEKHPRLQHLGLEPLDKGTDAEQTWSHVRQSKKPIKNLLMDASFIVGVGNIYASEALFFAGVHPQKIAGKMSKKKWQELLQQVKTVLAKAIAQGGTTLNDFVNSQGESGYFQLELAVYGRENQTCKTCAKPIKRIVQSGRSSFYCPGCQRI